MRRTRSLVTLAALSAAMVAAVSLAQPPAGGGGGGGGGGGRGGRGGGQGGGRMMTVDQAMQRLGRAYKALGTALDDANGKTEQLRSVGEVEASLVAAKMSTPDGLAADKADEYRTAVIDELSKAIELEKDVIGGKTADAKTAYKDLGTMRDAAHTKFKMKDPGQ